MESKSGGVRTTGAVGPKCSAISSWVNGVLVLNALRSQVICLPTELSGIVTVAGAAVGASARVRLRCRHTQPEVLNRFILEYRQPLVVVTRALPLDKWEKGCTRRTFVMTARASSWSRPKRTVALTALRFLRGVRGSDERTVLPTRPS